jgi:ribonuclease HI
MKKKKVKFYVVWKGRNTGIFDSWDECNSQIFGFEGAQYKSFPTKEEALFSFQRPYSQAITSKSSVVLPVSAYNNLIVKNSISVDAACSGNPGLMEYRGVETYSKKEIFIQGPFRDGTNNIGEFLALVHALALLKKLGKDDVTIYSDSRTAMSWVKKGKANTKLERTHHNEMIFELIHRAEDWLKKNTYQNPIVKWETEKWGEIPADFGRK